jgi:F-type H+-transporting ATPase subunit b
MEVGSMGYFRVHRRRFHAALLTVFAILAFDAASVARASGEGGGVTVVPDWTVGIQILNFLFLIFALNLLLFRPIRRILRERREKIKGMESAIDNAGKSVQEKDAAFEKAIRDARSKGLKEKETLVRQAEEEERRLVESVNSKAQAELEEIRRKIGADADRTRQSLQQQIGTFANDIAQKILGRAV